ncbi:MAG: aldehyde dehydrogenase family protein, partial [Opitutaceae bacterium]
MEIPNLIGGRWMAPTVAAFGEVFNPSRGEVIGRVPLGGAAEVDASVQAAARAFRSWATMPVLRRTAILFDYKRQLETHADAVARLITRENGKTLDEARGDVRRGIEVVDFACGIA